MVCGNCGSEMRDDAKFCPKCGAAAAGVPDMSGGLPQGAAPYSAPAVPAWEGPEGGGKKKTGLLIGIGAAVIAVIVLAVVAVSGLFASPKGQVEKALIKSAAAYQAAGEKLGMPDMEQWQLDQTIMQRMSLELKGINSELIGYDLSAFNGLGLRMGADYDGRGRRLSFELGGYWGEDDLLSFQLAADDAELCFGSPQLTGGTFYGVNTETMGADMAAVTGDDSMRGISFNLFDLVDMVLERIDRETMEQNMEKANQELWKAVEVKKEGAKTLDVNGTEIKTAAYRVTIPEEAMRRYVDALETVMSAMNYHDLYQDLFRAMGMPEDEVEDFLYALEDLDLYGELADGLRDAIDELGDVELEVCLSGGYVSAVLYEGRIGVAEVEISLCLGGGGEYVDDVSLSMAVDGGTIEVRSSGDHGLKGGTFTDETTVRVREDGGTLARVTSELTIDPGSGEDNFRWKLGMDSSGLSIFVLETEGGLDWGEDYLSLDLEEISLRAVGMEICTLGFHYYADCHPDITPVGDVKIITQMDERELERMVLDTQEQTLAWAAEMENLFLTRLPGDLLWAIMGGF